MLLIHVVVSDLLDLGTPPKQQGPGAREHSGGADRGQ